MTCQLVKKGRLIIFIPLLLFLALAVACGAAATTTPVPKAPAPPEAPKAPVAVPAAPAAPAAPKAPVAAPKPTPVPAAKPTPTPAPAVAKPAGTINVGQKELDRFIAHPKDQQNPQIFVVGTPPIVESLLHQDADRKIVGRLARSWSISEDAKKWTFNLQRGVKFHKGYGEMTAQDVVYSYGQWPLSKHPRASDLKRFWTDPKGSVETPDPYTVVVNIGGDPVPDVVGYRMFIAPGGGATWVVSKKQSEEVGADKASQDIAATGSWEIVDHRPAQFWKMRAVEKHWRKTPHFAELVFWQIPEESSRLAGYQTGQLDTFLMAFDSIPLVEKVAGTRLINVPNAIDNGLRFYGMWHIGIGTDKQRPGYDPNLPWVSSNPDLDSPEWERARKVRLALVTAIDRQLIIDTVLRGFGNTKTPLRSYTGFEHLLGGRDWEYNPDKAKKLLAEAGYPKGFSITLTPALRGAPAEVEACEVVASMWTNIGIDVKFQRVPYGTLRPQLVGRTYKGATCHAGSPILTPSYGYGSFLSDNPFNRGLEHPWLEEKMRQAAAEVNPVKRAALETEVGIALFDKFVTDVQLYNMDAVWPVGPRLDEVDWRPNISTADIRNINGYEFIRPRK